jgi:uncharacterized protein Yka (UPF0111/DUF47 family)
VRLEHLTTAEILCTQSPETDLERVLFDRIAQALEDVEEAQSEVVSCGHSMSDLEQSADELETLLEEIDSLHKHADDGELRGKVTRLYEVYCK